MTLFNGNGTLKKAAVIVSLIAGIFAFYWKVSDRVDTKISVAVAASEQRVVSSLETFEQRQDVLRQKDNIKLLNLKIEVLQDQIKSIERDLRLNPNDQELKNELNRKRQQLDNVREKLDGFLS